MSTSFQAIADVCNCGADLVQAVLQQVRDEIVDLVTVKKNNVTLNFLVGTLHITMNGCVQFKSLTLSEVNQQASQTQSVRLTEASLRGLDKMSQASSQRGLDDRRSQQSITERSINFMQQRQATNSIASASRRKAQVELFSADKIFAA